jgi:hypothetical protein
MATVAKQHREYTETPTLVIIHKQHKFRAWVAKNAYLLGFLSAMFFITWILQFVFN